MKEKTESENMENLSAFLNAKDEDELNKTLFKSVLECIEHERENAGESVIKTLEAEQEIFECGNILSLFLEKLQVDLGDYGFEEDEGYEWGFDFESEDDDNSQTFETLFEDLNSFVTNCIGNAFTNDGVLKEIPKLERGWNDD